MEVMADAVGDDGVEDGVGRERMTPTCLGFHQETSPSPSTCPHQSRSTASSGCGVPMTHVGLTFSFYFTYMWDSHIILFLFC